MMHIRAICIQARVSFRTSVYRRSQGKKNTFSRTWFQRLKIKAYLQEAINSFFQLSLIEIHNEAHKISSLSQLAKTSSERTRMTSWNQLPTLRRISVRFKVRIWLKKRRLQSRRCMGRQASWVLSRILSSWRWVWILIRRRIKVLRSRRKTTSIQLDKITDSSRQQLDLTLLAVNLTLD